MLRKTVPLMNYVQVSNDFLLMLKMFLQLLLIVWSFARFLVVVVIESSVV